MDPTQSHREFDVRRLAAVDMHAMSGTDLRRRVIIVEYVLGAAVGIVLGAFLLLATDSVLGLIIALLAIGIGANYVPLAYHALTLRSRERLEAEVARVDMPAELSYYNRSQFLVFVPLLFVWFALARRGGGAR